MSNKYLEKIAGNYLLDKDGKPDVLRNAAANGISGAVIGASLQGTLDQLRHSDKVRRLARNVGPDAARVIGNAFKPRFFSKRNLKAAGKFGAFLGGLSATSTAMARGLPPYSKK